MSDFAVVRETLKGAQDASDGMAVWVRGMSLPDAADEALEALSRIEAEMEELRAKNTLIANALRDRVPPGEDGETWGEYWARTKETK